MDNAGLRTSQAGVTAIAEHEGFEPNLYDCAAGRCTIGFGHLVHRGKTGTGQESETPFAAGISRPDALELLRSDILLAEASVQKFVRVSLTQPQFDALVSFVFNVGEPAFAGSTLLKHLNAGHFARAASQFDRWIMAGDRAVDGLRRRRARERQMFESGKVG